MTDSDIVERLRAITWTNMAMLGSDALCQEAADEIERLRKEVADAYSKSAQVIADLSANLCTASAMERERLTAERDEARRSYCYATGNGEEQRAINVAQSKGWDCFKENTND